jgi:RimJ/RimL family protein N-acetyltransferase
VAEHGAVRKEWETAHLLLRPWEEADRVELERLFGDPAVRGNRSVGPERIARFAAASLRHGLERIISVTAAAHTAARRVMEKAGLTYQGTRHWLSPDVPVVWYSIDRTTWKARTTS